MPDREGSGDNPFPPGYPSYFGTDGYTRPELLLKEAEDLAARFDRDGLRRSQLRAFYDHAKRQLQRLQYGAPFADVHADIAKLSVVAADRAPRAVGKLPASFKEFIDRNVKAASDRKSFEKGFMPHFEAVVGYCARIKE